MLVELVPLPFAAVSLFSPSPAWRDSLQNKTIEIN
jgi:hypothetical protein